MMATLEIYRMGQDHWPKHYASSVKNPLGYGKGWPNWPAYVLFGQNSIKIDLNMIQASRKQFQKEKSVNFQGKNVSRAGNFVMKTPIYE